jgi:hypothetical protein
MDYIPKNLHMSKTSTTFAANFTFQIIKKCNFGKCAHSKNHCV